MNIKELAGVAGVCESITNRGVWIAHTEELERFAELVRQDEREACANLLESTYTNGDNCECWLESMAEKIRARWQK